MEYNTTRGKLVIPEYGRNVQKLVEYAISFEEREMRNKVAHMIVYIMSQMHSPQKETGDYKRKLWDHMFIISGFRLDVDSPYPKPSPDMLYEKPERLSYKSNHIRFRHYGKNIENIIEKAAEFEDGPEKDALIKTIANHLKKSYLNWNRESVNDQTIEEHLKTLSSGHLELKESMELTSTSEILSRSRRKKFTRPSRDISSGNGSYNHSNNGGWRKRQQNHSGDRNM